MWLRIWGTGEVQIEGIDLQVSFFFFRYTLLILLYFLRLFSTISRYSTKSFLYSHNTYTSLT